METFASSMLFMSLDSYLASEFQTLEDLVAEYAQGSSVAGAGHNAHGHALAFPNLSRLVLTLAPAATPPDLLYFHGDA